MKMLLFFLLAATHAQAAHLIIAGSGGAAEYTQAFADQATRLQTVLTGPFKQTDVQLFGENTSPRSTKAELQKAFTELAKTHDSESDLFIYLIGHGSHLRNVSKFQIPGPDLDAETLNAWLAAIPAKRVVLINGASASAGFINILGGENRVIVTATKSIGQKNAVAFMNYFVQALEDGGADRNRDQRISVFEAAAQAAALTQTFYTGSGLLATENAILDDNGDQRGTRLHQPSGESLPGSLKPDGDLAKRVYLKDFDFPEAAPKDLIQRYLKAMERVEQHLTTKEGKNEQAYYAELERRVLAAAKLHQQIKSYE